MEMFRHNKNDGKLIMWLALVNLISHLIAILALICWLASDHKLSDTQPSDIKATPIVERHSHRQPIAQRVDVIELNHFVHEYGPGYSQVILWVWSPDYRRHDCVGWFIVNPNKLSDLPQATYDGFWVAKQGTNYFRAKVFLETRTSIDPERENGKLRGKFAPPVR